jgi:hypothetical protein
MLLVLVLPLLLQLLLLLLLLAGLYACDLCSAASTPVHQVLVTVQAEGEPEEGAAQPAHAKAGQVGTAARLPADKGRTSGSTARA